MLCPACSLLFIYVNSTTWQCQMCDGDSNAACFRKWQPMSRHTKTHS